MIRYLSSIVLLTAILLVPFRLHAAEVVAAEVRIDGSTVHTMDLSTSRTLAKYHEADFNVEIDSSSLTVGPHYLETRMQTGEGDWSEWQGRWIRVGGDPIVVAAEYYIDNDPGPGNATAIALPDDGAWDEPVEEFTALEVDTSLLSVGEHILHIRCQDSEGNWGTGYAHMFYVGEPLYVAGAEYTFEADALPGTGYPMEAADGTFDEPEEDLVAIADSALYTGDLCTTGTIYVRVQDSIGRWSSRGGLVYNEGTEEWEFDPDLGWTDDDQGSVFITPTRPDSPSPVEDENVLGIDEVLVWDEYPGDFTFDVWLWEIDEPDAPIAAGLTDNTYTIPGFLDIGIYNWKVDVHSSAMEMCSSEGSVWQFHVTGLERSDFDADNCTNINDFLFILDNWQQDAGGNLIDLEEFLALLDYWQMGSSCAR